MPKNRCCAKLPDGSPRQNTALHTKRSIEPDVFMRDGAETTAGRRLVALAMGLLIAGASQAFAQSIQLPGSVEPSRIQERLPPAPFAPPVSPPLTIESEESAQPAGAEN